MMQHTVQINTDVLFDEAKMLNVHHEIDRLFETQAMETLLIDLSSVSSTGSAGIGMLVRLKAKCDERGCRLELCDVSPVIREVLHITNLDQMFTIRDEAVKSME